jgi:DNA invertase Pin-like site-specific DNA recombinase
MKIGYARVSTRDQNLELQIEALQKYGCEQLFQEKQSAVKDRPELDKMLNILRTGDIVIVWKLDRLGRSLRHLVDLMALFKAKGVEFISLNDNIDTTTIQGRLIFNLFASFAEFERELIRERTMAGLKRAKENGRIGGRKKGLTSDAKKTAYAAFHLTEENKKKPGESRYSISDIIQLLKISRATYYRYLQFVKENFDQIPEGKRRKRVTENAK